MIIAKASLFCAITTTVLSLLFPFLGDSDVKVDSNLIYGVLMAGTLLWVVSFVLCICLLVVLSPVFSRTSLQFSFFLFAIIGFTIPAYLMYIFATIPAHGETPPLYRDDNIRTLLAIFTQGLVGLLGAVVAWFTLKANSKKTPIKSSQKDASGAGTSA